MNRRLVIVPLDDSLITGAEAGLERLRPKVAQIAEGRPDAVMGFPGLFENFCDQLLGIAGILNVTASTVRSAHTHKVLVGTVHTAVKLGLDCVAVHVNVSSKYESEMLRDLAYVADECRQNDFPLLAIMYPRSEAAIGDENYDDLRRRDVAAYAKIVAHAARVGVELGADLIKTQYTGDPTSFRVVVEACEPTPIVVAGGPVVEIREMAQMAYDAVSAGAAGISFGRNVFSRPDSGKAVNILKAIVHGGADPLQALDMFGLTDGRNGGGRDEAD